MKYYEESFHFPHFHPFPMFSTREFLESHGFHGERRFKAYADKKGHILRCLEYSKPLGAEGAWMRKDVDLIPCRDGNGGTIWAEECWDLNLFRFFSANEGILLNT